MDGLRPLLVHARVVQECRPFALVPRQVLDRHDVGLPLEEVRHEGLPEDVEKDAEGSVQKIHDKYIKKIDEMFAAKEKEIMTV